MSASRTAFALSKPEGSNKITAADFAYLRARNRLKAFDLVQQEFQRSGINQATLAARTQKDPGQLSRLLNAPGNLTLDTISDLLFAISGAVPQYGLEYPMEKPASKAGKTKGKGYKRT